MGVRRHYRRWVPKPSPHPALPRDPQELLNHIYEVTRGTGRSADGEALVYSDRRAKRNLNIRANPRVTLHLADDGRGGDVVVVEGEARIDETVPRPEDNAAYNRKYGEWIRDQFTTAEEFTSVYNVPVRIRPTRGRAFGA